MSTLPFPQSAINPKRKGFLRRQLRIPVDKTIPTGFLRKIVNTPIGNRVKNPTKTGIKEITVTLLLHQRAHLALVLRGLGDDEKSGRKNQ